MSVLFQSTTFRIKKEMKENFEKWFSFFQSNKKIELDVTENENKFFYQFSSGSENNTQSFLEIINDPQLGEVFSTFLEENEECWVLETECCEESLVMNHQAVKITSETISNKTLEEFVYRHEEDTVVARYERIMEAKKKLNLK